MPVRYGTALLFFIELSQYRPAAQLAARLRQYTLIAILVGIMSAGRLHLGAGGRVLLVVICIRDACCWPNCGVMNEEAVVQDRAPDLNKPQLPVLVLQVADNLTVPVLEQCLTSC